MLSFYIYRCDIITIYIVEICYFTTALFLLKIIIFSLFLICCFMLTLMWTLQEHHQKQAPQFGLQEGLLC